MEYSPGIQFQTILINMEEAKALTTSNHMVKKQPNWCWCGSINHLQVTSKYFLVGLEIGKAKIWPWGWGYLNTDKIMQQNIQQQRKRANV